MAIQQWMKEEIQKAVHEGRSLHDPTPEKMAYYNAYKNNVATQVIERAKTGGVLYSPSAWKQSLYDKNIKQQQPGTGSTSTDQTTGSGSGGTFYNPMPGGGANVPGSNPVLDQTPPVIITNPGNTPTVPIGSGSGNPTNRLELNSLVAVVVGFVFIRGAFKLLTKIF